MLKLTQLSVIYPDKTRAVDAIDLTIHDGETVALIGANGAGKTSLLLALVGVVASHGTIEVDELKLEPHTVGEIRKRIGVVFQNPDNQLFMPSIYEDVAFGLRNYGMAEEEIEGTVDRCLDQLDIMKLKHRSPLKLSGGEKRMAAIAGVLVMEPSLMLFDEPTAFLDPKARRNLIQSLQKLKPTKLIATHDLPFVAEVCSRAILLKDGKIFADGDPHTMLYDKKLMEECGIEAAVRPMEDN